MAQWNPNLLDLVGPDHVGVGCDWDGGGGVAGMEDVAAIPKITERLVKLGYTERQLAAFWGGNALRVLKAAHAARKPADTPVAAPTNERVSLRKLPPRPINSTFGASAEPTTAITGTTVWTS